MCVYATIEVIEPKNKYIYVLPPTVFIYFFISPLLSGRGVKICNVCNDMARVARKKLFPYMRGFTFLIYVIPTKQPTHFPFMEG